MYIGFKVLFIFLFFNSFGSNGVNYPDYKYERSDCVNGNKKGVCKLVTNCPSAILFLAERKPHGLERCGFDGFIEIVCCPFNETHTNDKPISRGPDIILPPISVRKSEAACKRYSKGVPPDPIHLILGGDNATLGEFPHMALLGYKSGSYAEVKWSCGGSLISNKFVVTAAHCILNQEQILPTIVRMGIVDLTGSDNISPTDRGVKNIVIHPNYTRTKLNDIALIELDRKVSTNLTVYPACLYQKSNDPIGLVITGWGHTAQGGDLSDFLQKAILQPVSLTECSSFYEPRILRPIVSTQICAVSDDGTKDTCQGDSGGPLQVQQETSSIYTIVGITSFGSGCGGKNPGIYTRIYSYLDWIEDNVWP